jgi:DsbC/DsbD-like thiol-disulfide interchange protein
LNLSVLVAASLAGAAAAQPPSPSSGDTVAWTVAAPDAVVTPGERLSLILHGTVRQGWHVYGLKQAPTGPTPLRVGIEAGEVARADGPPKGSPPVKEHSRAFDADTEFYAAGFTIAAPVRIGAHPAAGRQQIPVSVQFQTCNGDICQPPKAARLLVPVTVRANG